MEVYEFVTSPTFNAVFSIYVHILIVLAPAFAVAALLRN